MIKNKISKEEQMVIDMNSPSDSYDYCFDNQVWTKVNVGLHQEIIINSKSGYYIYKFARYIEGADIELLENAIIKSSDVYYMIKFYMHISRANKKKIQDAILMSGDKDNIIVFIEGYLNTTKEDFFRNNILPTNDIVMINNFVDNIGF